MSNSFFLNELVNKKYDAWFNELISIMINYNLDLEKYDQEIIRNYFADGLTPEETLKELLSEVELPTDRH